MSRLRDVLRAADPLRVEPPADRDARLREARARLHATDRASLRARRGPGAVADAAELRTLEAAPRRRVVMAVALGAVAMVASLAVWQRGATPAMAAVRFEIRLAEESAAPGLREAPVGSDPRIVYLHDDLVVSNDHVAAAHVRATRDADRFGVEIVFTPEGASRMFQATSVHIGRPVALLVDGLVVMAPTVRSAIGDRALLTGDYTRAEAERVAAGLLLR